MQGTVRYSEEFIKPDGCKYWVSHEIQYDQESQDPPFSKAAKTVKDFASAHTSPAYQQYMNPNLLNPDIQVEKEPEIGLTPQDILSSPDLVVLEQSYRWLIKGKPELERAYILRHDQLTQKQ
jgi:hypothetical protein